MVAKPTYRIDGARFNDLEGFYDQVESQVLGGKRWGRNLDALNDAMAGEFGGLHREFRLEWVNSRLSEARLVQAGTGGFADLVQIIRGHPNVELVLL